MFYLDKNTPANNTQIISDAVLDDIKQELRQKIALLDSEKSIYEQKLHEIEDVALQGDNPLATNTAILAAINILNERIEEASKKDIDDMLDEL